MKSVQNQVMMHQKEIKTAFVCEIEWNRLSVRDYDAYLRRAVRGNLLQSADYVRAMARMNKQSFRIGLVKIDGAPAGLVHILEASLFRKAIHAVILDRGPIWLDGFGDLDHFKSFMNEFARQFPKRFGRRVRVIPNAVNDQNAQNVMDVHGYNTSPDGAYQTIWLDLKPDLEDLRAGFKKKWRNSLTRGEKSALDVVISDEGQHFAWAMNQYAIDRAQKSYDGASVKAMVALAKQFSRGKNMIVATALFDGKPIAAIVIFIHGASATYQIGCTTDKGRNLNAHHVLLWHSIMCLKERTIHDFDLGGINDEDAKGVRDFKKGLGGEIVETLGLYS